MDIMLLWSRGGDDILRGAPSPRGWGDGEEGNCKGRFLIGNGLYSGSWEGERGSCLYHAEYGETVKDYD